MSQQANPTRIGAFVVLSFFLLVAGIVVFGGGALFRDNNYAIVYFDGSLQGLDVGAPVAYQGITIGQVKEIQIDVNTDTYQITTPVLISLIPDKVVKMEGRDKKYQQDINTFIKTMCDRGLRATLKTQSLLTGKLYIDLAIHPNKEAVYRDREGKYLEIPTIPSELQQISQAVQSLDFMELAAKFANTLDALEKMSITMEQALGSDHSKKNLDTFFTSLDHARSILAKLDQGLLPLMDKLDISLTRAARLSDNTEQMIGRLNDQINPFFENLNKTARDMGLAMQTAEILLTELRQSLGMDSPLYYQLTESINELGRAANAMRAFTEHLDRNPQRLLFGADQQGESSK